MPQIIPISVAEKIAKDYKYQQIMIYARDCESGQEHMTTYGITKAHCSAAAKIGKFLQDKIIGWNKEQMR